MSESSDRASDELVSVGDELTLLVIRVGRERGRRIGLSSRS